MRSAWSAIHPLHSPGSLRMYRRKDVEDLYLSTGRYFWNKRTPSDLNTALTFFKHAIQRDPSYASPYVGLADTYFLMVEFAALQPRDAYPPAQIAAARRAIALDSHRCPKRTARLASARSTGTGTVRSRSESSAKPLRSIPATPPPIIGLQIP